MLLSAYTCTYKITIIVYTVCPSAVRFKAEKWAKPLRSNYLLHSAFIRLEFADIKDLAHKVS